MTHVTVDWNPLGEVFFRRTELYSMGWKDSVDLSKFIVAAASFGGPIALTRDDRHTVRVHGGVTKPYIYIYSSSGQEIATVRWDGGTLVHMGWSVAEDLLCVAEDGTVSVYDIHGVYKRTFSMGQDAKESKVIECRLFSTDIGTGLAILTGNYHFFVVNNVEEARLRRFIDPPGLDAPPSSWLVMPRGRGSEILVAIDSTLFIIDQGQFSRKEPPFSKPINSVTEMALAWDSSFLALFTDTGMLWIGKTVDLQNPIVEYNTMCPSRPKQLIWCGTSAIVCYWDDYLDVIGPWKDSIRYYMDSTVHLTMEPDGIRIIGNDNHEILQKVPIAVENVFKIGSMEPGAMLYDASKEFEKKSARADEYIRMIKERLREAVEQCIQAAGSEYEPSLQRALLRAASFGKSFTRTIPPEPFVTMCQTLRVLNAVRDFNVGIPLTIKQGKLRDLKSSKWLEIANTEKERHKQHFRLEQLTMRVLIDRLVLRRHYCLAIRICDYLKIPKAEGASRILGHWACYKVQQTNVIDEEIARAINAKLGETAGISYTEIASKALECGRTELAIKLLDYEPRVADQVPLLMRMKKPQLALEKAIISGDTDLVYMVVMHLKDTLTLGDFLMAIRHLPVALSLYVKYCKEQDRRMLVDLYYQDDQFLNSGNVYVQESDAENTVESRIKSLTKAQMSYQQGNHAFFAKATEEQIKLLEYQIRLEEQLKRTFVNLPLSETIYQCIVVGNLKSAEALKKEFKVPDKRYYWLKVRALAESRNWLEMEKFSKSRKSPIGYEPFVDACLEFQNRLEAEKYVVRVAPENKVKYYIKVGKLDDAADTAFSLKSEEGLDLVLSRCSGNRPLVSKINTMKAQLTQRR